MSFSKNAKLEIIENKPYRIKAKIPQAYGLFLYAQAFGTDEMHLQTELPELVELYAWFAENIGGNAVKVEQAQPSFQKRVPSANHSSSSQFPPQRFCGKYGGCFIRPLHSAIITEAVDRETLIQTFADAVPDPAALENERHIDAFISGAFLACGTVSNPSKAYRLEFALRNEKLAAILTGLIEKRTGQSPALTQRRGHAVAYLKKYGHIEDMLALMGASKAALAVIDVEMIKEVRNRANRAANCVTANITKQVDAAVKQLEDIELVLRNIGMESLPEPLGQAAILRREHPEASLGELSKLSPDPVSRSGLHHRFAAIARMAEELRRDQVNA